MLELTANRLLDAPGQRRPGQTVARIEQELTARPHLAKDFRLVRREHKADLRDARQARTAAEAIGKLPGKREATHLVISGRFALWDMVPAVLDLSGVKIKDLHIATLGFGKRNISKLCSLIDAADIGNAKLLCSHYFAGTSQVIYDYAAKEFAKRPQMDFLSIRTHAKLVLLALADGRRLTIESSANLRSCKNVEQASLFGDPRLYDFHRAWIDSLFSAAHKDGAR